MLCPFCFHLGMNECCCLSGCWNSTPHKATTPEEVEQKEIETAALAVLLSTRFKAVTP